MADNPTEYRSQSETISLARETMREIREVLTKDAQGNFPAKYADMWDGIDIPPPDTAWQDMDIGQRYDLLVHVLDEWIGSLELSAEPGELRESKKLALEFVEQDARQAMPGFRAEGFDALTTQLEEFRDEFARLARTTGQTALAEKFGAFVGEARWVIARLAEARPAAVRQSVVPDAFDGIVANLREQWYEDGRGDGVETWEEQSAMEKIGYLAEYAAAHNVSFERFVESAGRTLGLAAGEEFTPDEVGHLLRQIRWAHGDYSEDRARMATLSARNDRLRSPGELAEVRGGPEPQQPDRGHDNGCER